MSTAFAKMVPPATLAGQTRRLVGISLLLCGTSLSACSQQPIAVSDQRYGASDSSEGGDATAAKDDCLSLADAVIGYDVTIQKIVAKQCLGGCHEAGLQTPPLSTYAEVKAAATVALESITSGRMPRRRTISAEEKKLFAAWVSTGMAPSDAAATGTPNAGINDQATKTPSANAPVTNVIKKPTSGCKKSKITGAKAAGSKTVETEETKPNSPTSPAVKPQAQ